MAGYTSYHASAGQISSATIQLEDPSQDAVIAGAAGAAGALTYSGTDATLEQVLLHEIGHALGLADDSDQDSVMYYELTSSNRMLDCTDVTGIRSLYGSSSMAEQSEHGGTGIAARSGQGAGQTAVDHQLGQLITGMASFNPPSAGSSSPIHDAVHERHMVLAASGH